MEQKLFIQGWKLILQQEQLLRLYTKHQHMFKKSQDNMGLEYSMQNPTRSALEKNLASIEGGKFGICYSSEWELPMQ